ncbi:hypothetical protein Dsin_022981 [Dipteronia sinensis]|uniref:F-box domain-containing protein n=1 Tax=Dipteronia sinensis TaxID=43782 RepID=A0AAE0A427_9ROSI|nr:hypothetical protein Dsin_022981 [Dipteronia sinensis]
MDIRCRREKKNENLSSRFQSNLFLSSPYATSPTIPALEGGYNDEVGRDGDRLSSLPENIIRHIFLFLGSIDIVRASSVSKQWRYFWVSMPYLNFESNGYDFGSRSEIKFNYFVNWVLMSRNRLVDMQRFRISHLHLKENSAFYRLMDVITGFNLHEIDLTIESKDEIELPQCILNCGSLVSLKLYFRNCVLKQQTFPGFSKLKSLELCFVMFIDSLSLANFVSSCPVLENLSVEGCMFVDDNIIDITSTGLKDLSFILPKLSTFFKYPIRREQAREYGLKVACPNRLSLKVINLRSLEFSFQEMNSLQNLFMDLDHHYGPYGQLKIEGCHALSKMLQGVYNLKALKVSEAFLEYLHQAVDTGCFSPSFNNLKSLTLGIKSAHFNKHSLINMLDCSPNLEALKFFLQLSNSPIMSKAALKMLNIPDDPWKMPNMPNGTTSCLKYNLKIIELFQVRDDKYELDLVRFFLKNGPVLQKMGISWVYGHGNTDEIISEVLKFPRSSPNVALTFIEPLDISFYGKS